MRDSRAVVVTAALVVVVGTLPMAVAALGAGSAEAISVGDTVTGAPSGTVDASPGETVTVRVWANATAVRGYQTNLTFDPSVVTVDSVSGSDDFEKPVATIDDESGWVAFNQLRSGETDDPVLAVVTLTVSEDAPSSTQLSFVQSDTKLSDGDGEGFSPNSFNSVELAVGNDSATPTENGTATATPPEDGTTTPTPTPTETDSDDGSNGNDGDDGSSNDGSSSDDSDDDDNSNSGGGGGGGGGGGAIAPPEPSFAIVETSLNRTSVAPGDPVMVSGTVENDGDEDGTFEAYVSRNGTAMGANTTVEIPDGEQRQVNVTVRFDSPGVHAVTLNSTAVGNVTVRTANATANATANGTANGTTNATANGTTNTTVTPTSEPTTTATDTRTATATATATATPAATDTDSAAEETPASGIQTVTTSESGPGFGAASVAVALSLLLGWLGYRRPET